MKILKVANIYGVSLCAQTSTNDGLVSSADRTISVLRTLCRTEIVLDAQNTEIVERLEKQIQF
jgi:hypothetical protein